MAAPPRHAPSSSKRPPPMQEAEPDVSIDEFKRGKEIGKGSFATVYLAQHREKRSYAAVKAVQMAKLNKKLKDNLGSEINILKGLRHPHIVQLFKCVERPHYIYLVMEYCQLSDLAQFMKKRHTLPNFPETADIFKKYPNPEHGGLNEVLARHFLKQVASALKYLRSKNLIHRDIKPQNLLLNPAPTYMSKLKPEDVPLAASADSLMPAVGVASLPMLKLADFGFARHLPSTSMAETLCGSPLYMAPEILRYEKYDARADLWSIGTVLHEMIVGKPPFRAQNHVDLLRKIEKANDQIIFDNKNMTISRGVKDLIRALLKKSPLERMTYEDLFEDVVVVGEIPGLVNEDRPQERVVPRSVPEVGELGQKMTIVEETPRKATIVEETSAALRAAPEQQKRPQDLPRRTSSRKSSEQDMNQQQAEEAIRRTSSSGSQGQAEAAATSIKRQPSQRGQRRPSIVAHITAPGRQELQQQHQPLAPVPTMQRRASRSSPLAGPPLVREPTFEEKLKNDRTARKEREQTQQDLTFEKEYVVVEKRAVEVNAFADELEAVQDAYGSPARHGAMVRRATTQGQPTSQTGATPASPSRAVQQVTSRAPSGHVRAGSFERRNGPATHSATHMLSKALNAAQARIFGTSPPPSMGGPSPPHGYSAFPPYPIAGTLTTGHTNEIQAPMDEGTKFVGIMEAAAHRSNAVFSFAEVKYRQLLPATPSSQDALGIQQIESHERSGDDDDMTPVAVVGVAEEALVLYVKALAILSKTIDLAGQWWSKQGRSDGVTSDQTSNSGSSSAVTARITNIVKWSRVRFNECLEKSEVVGRKLQHAQKQLPEDHPGHPHNQAEHSGTITTSAEHIRITSGITAARLMFDRAVEMSRQAALNELLPREDLQDSEINYQTAIMLLEAVLENDDEPLMPKPSAKREVAADEVINGIETADRQTVISLIDGAKTRLNTLRKKIHMAQQQNARRSSISGASTPKAGNPSALSPTIANT